MQIDQFCDATRAWLAAGRHENVAGVPDVRPRARPGGCEPSAGEAPTLLLLHGFPTSCYDWRGVVERLAPRIRAIAPDLFGFGLSDKPVAYSYSLFQQADTIEELLGRLKVRAAHVVSHDLGTSLHSELLGPAGRGATDVSSCNRRPFSTAACCNGSPRSPPSRSSWPPTPRCRKRSKSVAPCFRRALRARLAETDAATRGDYAHRCPGDGRSVAIPGRPPQAAGAGRLYARAVCSCRSLAGGHRNRSTRQCKSCGPTATRSLTSTWAANWRGAARGRGITSWPAWDTFC